ncbi:MAG TPA: YkgJ family cysteine cluster protein [Desulfobacterales bacterium]|nr:YkgJ family cysteine cluster protein [Desulfobacterales bacterium]
MKITDIFKCQQCGDCCKGFGGTFVTEKEIEKIAASVHTDPKTFVEKYCQVSGGKPLLTQGRDRYCIFWDGRCSIHPVKPRMCKNWPFLKSILADINNWHIMASLCPGIRTDVPDSTIKAYVTQELSKNS